MLRDLKLWVSNAKKFLKNISAKIRWAADLVDWFVDALDSLPLPNDDTTRNDKPGSA